MKTFTTFLALLLLCATSIATLVADDVAPLFPFVITGDVGGNITDVSAWNDAPAGKHGFIRVEGEKFVNDKGRVLFWGTNTCFSMNFPERAEAEKVAARLARFGFNCVRLHHMDRSDIWGGPNAKSQTVIDPGQLDKLDYFIFQLKQNGVYVNLNLHVSRKMDDRDGFPAKDERPDHDKGVDNFYPPMIALQKKYARDLLEHVNPYTKTAYKEEPAIAMIEINNENSVVSQWARGTKLLSMPDPYASEFRKQWNEFLQVKYKTTAALASAWGFFDIPLGNEMLAGGAQGSEVQQWEPQIDSDTRCKTIPLDGGGMRFEIEKMGRESWIPQLIARGIKVEKDKPYTFSFRAKANEPKKVTLQLRRDSSPWSSLGFHKVIDLTTEWQSFTFTLMAPESHDRARFDIGGFSPGVFDFADSSFKPGGSMTLRSGQSLEAGTVPLVDKTGSGLSLKAADDFCEFLFDIEEKYWLGMYRYIKDELKAKQPISGTQMRYGSTTIQAKLDYCDNHAYWGHPVFPGRPWDGNNWTIRNRALVNHLDQEVLPMLATERPAGKPYTISEFDAPYPNQYAAEALPILAAFGRFQGWDGIFHFAYSHNRTNIDTKMARSFFDMVGNTVKLAHQPACAAMFRRGDVAEGKTLILGGMDSSKELEIFKREKGTSRFNFRGIGIDPQLALEYRTALDLSGTTSVLPNVGSGHIKAEGGQLIAFTPFAQWKAGYCVNTPNSKLYTGFPLLTNSRISNGELRTDYPGIVFEDVHLDVLWDRTRLGWATISMVSMNANGFDPAKAGAKPIRVLVTATGLMQNTDMTIEPLDGDKITVGNRWGKEPVLCEGIPFDLRVEKATSLKCYPLDENGNRREEIKTEGKTVRLGPAYKTIWYEVEIR